MAQSDISTWSLKFSSVCCQRLAGFLKRRTESVQTLSTDQRYDLVLIVEARWSAGEEITLRYSLSTVRLDSLVRRALDLDSGTSTNLRLLDNVLGNVVDLDRSTAIRAAQYRRYSHLAKSNDLPLASLLVNLDDTHRCSQAQRSLDDIDTKNDRISAGERADDLETHGPDSVRGSLFPLGLEDLLHVLCKGVEQVVDDHGLQVSL